MGENVDEEQQLLPDEQTAGRSKVFLAFSCAAIIAILWLPQVPVKIQAKPRGSVELSSISSTPKATPKWAASCSDKSDYEDRFWSEIYIYDLENGSMVTTKRDAKGAVSSLAFSDKYLVAGSYDNKVYVYDLENNFQLVNTLVDSKLEVGSVASSGKYLASGSFGCTCFVYDMEDDFALVQTLQRNGNFLHSVAVSGIYLAFGCDDKLFVYAFWDNEFRLLNTLSDPTFWNIRSVAFSGTYLAAAALGDPISRLNVYDLKHGDAKLVKTLNSTNETIFTSVAFSDKYLVAGSDDTKVRVYDLENEFKPVKTLSEPGPDIVSRVPLAFSGKYIASCPYEEKVYVYDSENNFTLVQTLSGIQRDSWVNFVALSK